MRPIIGSMPDPACATRSAPAGARSVAKSSGETFVNLKIAAPEFGPYAICCRLVKREQPAEDGATHMILWDPRT
jgi:uncharacterized protein (DUF736 family)